jgi:hypothetical protein
MSMRRPSLPLLPSFSSSRFTQALCLTLALASAGLAAGCGTAQSALPFVPADAPLRYSTYFNPQGQLRGEEWALALMGHSRHRELVFLQTQQGLFPASEAWLYLEAVCRGAGALTAQDHARSACAAPVPLPDCELDWKPVRTLIAGEGPGRERLLDTFKQGYDERWAKLLHRFRAQAEVARAGMLMAGVSLGRTPAAAESKAATAESRAATAESRAATAEGRALSAEARTMATEAEAAGATTARLVSAESLHLTRALSAEEASALETRLLELEAESSGTREAFSRQELLSGRLTPKPRPSELSAEDSLRWDEYEAYRQRRFHEVRSQQPAKKGAASLKPPLRWEDYREFRNHFQLCLQFEMEVGGILLRELELPAGSRRVLTGSSQQLLARHVGTTKQGQEGVRYPDFLAVDEATLKQGRVPRVESISVKKRDFSRLSKQEVGRMVDTDIREATNKYGGELEVRRPGHPLYGRTVQVSKIHLIYEADGVGAWQSLIKKLCDDAGVEVHFE